MLLAVIVACEIAFWVLLLLGLLARYPARRPRLGAGILLTVPAVDVVLLAVTLLHLRAGGEQDFGTGLAAAYIGASVAFGPSLVRRLDARFARRWTADAAAPPPRRYGADRARWEWAELRRATVAFVVAAVLLLGGVLLVGGFDRGQQLVAWILRLALVLLIWLVVTVSYTVWPTRPPDRRRG